MKSIMINGRTCHIQEEKTMCDFSKWYVVLYGNRNVVLFNPSGTGIYALPHTFRNNTMRFGYNYSKDFGEPSIGDFISKKDFSNYEVQIILKIKEQYGWNENYPSL